MSDKLPWFPMNALQFANSRTVRRMTAEQVGAYVLLLCEEWASGALPDDMEFLAGVAKVSANEVANVLDMCFVKRRKRWTNKRLEVVRKEQSKKHEGRSRAGTAGAKARWDKGENGNRIATASNRIGSKKESKSKKREETTTTSDDGFDEFWEAYPKRAGGNPKKPALTRWCSAVKRDEPANIIAGTERYAAYCDATKKTGTEYVMQATTFLGEREGWTETWAVTEADRVSTEAEDPGVAFNREWDAHTTPEDDSEPVRVGGLVENLLRHVQQEGTA